MSDNELAVTLLAHIPHGTQFERINPISMRTHRLFDDWHIDINWLIIFEWGIFRIKREEWIITTTTTTTMTTTAATSTMVMIIMARGVSRPKRTKRQMTNKQRALFILVSCLRYWLQWHRQVSFLSVPSHSHQSVAGRSAKCAVTFNLCIELKWQHVMHRHSAAQQNPTQNAQATWKRFSTKLIR